MDGYSYATIESALAAVFEVPNADRGRFRARLKHLQRLGLPGVEAGKGTRIAYTREQVHELLLALLGSAVGVDPAAMVRIVENHRKVIAGWMRQAVDQESIGGNPVFLSMRPRLMAVVELEWIGRFRRYDYHVKDKSGRPIRRDNINLVMDREPGWLCVRDLTADLIRLHTALEGRE